MDIETKRLMAIFAILVFSGIGIGGGVVPIIAAKNAYNDNKKERAITTCIGSFMIVILASILLYLLM